MRKGARRAGAWAAAALAFVALPVQAPAMLAFPYQATIGAYRIHAERPIDSTALERVLARADARLAATPLSAPQPVSTVFLTDGGWRWRLLANASVGAFAISQPMTGAIIINRSDATQDRVYNGAAIGGSRTLSGVIAHEVTHNLLRRHFGIAIDRRTPPWKLEGYCDYVAGDGSLSDADAAKLVASHASHPALPYYLGRRRVTAMLTRNGGSVDALFATRD